MVHVGAGRVDDDRLAAAKLGRKDYENELAKLQAREAPALAPGAWHKDRDRLRGGRDGAGKGGTIKAIMDCVSPRDFPVA